MRLRTRLTLIIGLASIAPLALTGIVATRLAERYQLRQARELQVRQAEALAVFVSTWLDSRVRNLELSASLFPAERLDQERLRGLMRLVYRDADAVNAVALMDREATPLLPPVAVSGAEDLVGALSAHQPVGPRRLQAFLDRVPVAAAVDDGRAIGTPYRPPDGAEPVVPVAVKLPGSSELLAAELSLAEVAAQVRAQAVPDGAAVLVGRGGRILMGARPELVLPELLGRFRGGVAGELDYALENGTRVVAAFEPIVAAPWIVVVAVPRELAVRAGREIRLRTWYTVLLAAVLAVVLGSVGARQIARPVLRLRRAAQAVGEGHAGAEVEPDGAAEQVELALAFNRMSSRLARQQAEISAFNRELQQRVDERTRELAEAQRRLLRTSRMAAVAQLSAGLAHELNNPVAGILGLAQLGLARKDATVLSGIESQARRCREILLALARLSGEGAGAPPQEVDMGRLASEAVTEARGGYHAAGLVLDLRQGGPAPVRGDPTLLVQAMVQLLRAARAGLAPGGEVELRVAREKDEVSVEIVPSGEPRRHEDDRQAAGMAIWVARRVLVDHGGRLQERPDGGFRALLPAG